MIFCTCRPLTEKERLTSGLLGLSPAPKLQVLDFGTGKGRGVVAMQPIPKGAYVCEYRTYRVYPVGSAEEAKLAHEYDLNGEGSYVLQTAHPVPEFGARLCFDATRRYRDVGRLINHSSSLYNLKPGPPLFLRGKWRVAMLAVRDIFVGQELTYDYGVRSENWMKKRPSHESRDGGQGMKRARGDTSRDQSTGRDMSGAKESSEEDNLEDDDIQMVEDSSVQILEDPSTKSSSAPVPHHRRNYFWCPEVDCTSGPVQKMSQHLQKKHKMSSAMAAQISRKKRRAPDEAVKMKVPNPYTRSSGLQHLGLFVKKGSQSSNTTSPTTTTPAPAPTETPSTSTSNPPPTHLFTPNVTGNFHQGGQFLDGFHSHLRTRAGGQRGEHSATQITRYVGKYLHSLNTDTVVEGYLLEPAPILPYLEEVQKGGIGSSGILHRILAHKAAVKYMRLGVSSL